MIIRSTYEEGERLPGKYANLGVEGGQNISPPFYWEGGPVGTKSFALVMVDRHPIANDFVHWLVVNISGGSRGIDEGVSPTGATELNTDYGRPGYGGLRPPAGTGDHGYETTVYALSVDKLDLDENITLVDFENALNGKVIGLASLTGFFSQ